MGGHVTGGEGDGGGRPHEGSGAGKQAPLAGEADGDAGQDRPDARPRQDRHVEQLQQLVADPDGGDVFRAQAEHAQRHHHDSDTEPAAGEDDVRGDQSLLRPGCHLTRQKRQYRHGEHRAQQAERITDHERQHQRQTHEQPTAAGQQPTRAGATVGKVHPEDEGEGDGGQPRGSRPAKFSGSRTAPTATAA